MVRIEDHEHALAAFGQPLDLGDNLGAVDEPVMYVTRSCRGRPSIG
jgi:hypothetical protein